MYTDQTDCFPKKSSRGNQYVMVLVELDSNAILVEGMKDHASVHIVSIICGADKSFPLHLWCQLLPQAEHTINMLCPSRMTPTVSAYAYLWGQHDYNANPYAPLGCKVEAYLYPGIRETWAPHTASGHCLGNSKEHYQCHQIYISDTRHTRVRAALQNFPTRKKRRVLVPRMQGTQGEPAEPHPISTPA